jgi:hypothetical protein
MAYLLSPDCEPEILGLDPDIAYFEDGDCVETMPESGTDMGADGDTAGVIAALAENASVNILATIEIFNLLFIYFPCYCGYSEYYIQNGWMVCYGTHVVNSLQNLLLSFDSFYSFPLP